MSVLQQLKSALPMNDEAVEQYEYECRACGHTFRSTKKPGRAICEECRSADVDHLE